MVTENCKMPRFRQISFLVLILSIIGLLLLFHANAGRKQLIPQSEQGQMFDVDPIDENEMSPEEKKHRDILREGKLNIPELGLNFIEEMEHNRKVLYTPLSSFWCIPHSYVITNSKFL